MSALTNDTPEHLAILASGKGILCVLDQTGDTQTIFDPTVDEELARVEALFEAELAKGSAAFAVNAAGEGTVVKSGQFPAEATKVIVTPRLVGG